MSFTENTPKQRNIIYFLDLFCHYCELSLRRKEDLLGLIIRKFYLNIISYADNTELMANTQEKLKQLYKVVNDSKTKKDYPLTVREQNSRLSAKGPLTGVSCTLGT